MVTRAHTEERAPFFDVHADRGQHRGVLRRPGTGDVRQVRRWLVLVAAPARLFASRSGDRSVCYELLSLSPCDAAPRHRPSLNRVLKWAVQRAPSRRSGPTQRIFCSTCFHIASAASSRGSRCQTEVRKRSYSNWLLARPKRFELLTPRFVV
jgi:hypothetical protein